MLISPFRFSHNNACNAKNGVLFASFDIGINIFGVTNWVRTLQSIPPWWEAQKEALYDELGDPATDAERHRRISPLFHAGNIIKPTLVVQGEGHGRPESQNRRERFWTAKRPERSDGEGHGRPESILVGVSFC